MTVMENLLGKYLMRQLLINLYYSSFLSFFYYSFLYFLLFYLTTISLTDDELLIFIASKRRKLWLFEQLYLKRNIIQYYPVSYPLYCKQ